MHYALLGPLDVRDDDGAPVAVGGPRPRTLLALLLLDAGHVVPTERLLDGLYGDHPPEGAANALQSQVSRLRRRILGAPIEFHPAGYRLAVDPDDVDALRFTRLAADGRRALTAGDHARASALLHEALGLWRGPALADVDASAQAEAHATRLEGARQAAVEDRAEADIALGRAAGLTAELAALTAADPLRERLRALHMRALAAEGRQAEALRVFEETRELLADELGADPSAELTATHTAILRARPVVGGARVGVPAQFTSFVGRRADVAAVEGLLTTSRLVTVTGPGGVGKTRLAVEAARDACFVDLAAVAKPEEVPGAISTALGVRQAGLLGPADPVAQLTAALTGEDVLLILDNCEHVVDAVAHLAHRLLGAAPGLRVLATSREALGITGEALYPLTPLSVDDDAVRLFAARAAAVRAGFTVDETNADDVRRICAALDGLPLAVELAAARLRLLGVTEIADRLGDRFRLLSRGERVAAPRHQTLRAVVEWSWDLLSPAERELLGRLAVFTGAAGVDAVAHLAGLSAGETEELLVDLADKSLVQLADGRARLLETVRAFAAESLHPGEHDRLQRAHAEYFLALAREAEPALLGHGQLDAMAALNAEGGNFHAAVRWAVTADPRLALDLTTTLATYWWLRGDYAEGGPAARDLLRALPEDTEDESFVLCVSSAASIGAASTADLARATGIMAALKEPLKRSFTTVIWAMTTGPDGDNLDAPPADYPFGEDPWSRALAELGHAMVMPYTALPGPADDHLEAALEGFRAVGDRWGCGETLDELGHRAGARGDARRALDLFDEAVRLSEELGTVADSAARRCSRAEVLFVLHGPERADAEFRAALDLARRSGNSAVLAGVHRSRGALAHRSGDPVAAIACYERALDEISAGAFVADLEHGRLLVGLARALGDGGDHERALVRLDEAVEILLNHWFLPALGEAARTWAAINAGTGRWREAAGLLGLGEALAGPMPKGFDDDGDVESAVRGELGEADYAAAHDPMAALSRGEAVAVLRGLR
ncbi:BTAD domain-containing putative transcriptional regulator [Phytomonospora endophytica]|uniref:Putative ATPase n=1 Tax=Phytomonospora endophytica TaxID=714109 RepID=A0A841FQM4_9ACTN|nr:BTAD domain-containing putative transcriptional regulator [Phytomonospora endophytica]MBB6034260.1 putative ATPase [Phytomonospora endophytica]GIG66652.1 SARP family transcriptional regulator [Phytomonospora endophytica]